MREDYGRGAGLDWIGWDSGIGLDRMDWYSLDGGMD